MVDNDQLEASSRRFLRAAFKVLSGQHVIPVSGFRGYLRVGYDYAGPDMMALAEFKALEGP